jgi:hypothetical protein
MISNADSDCDPDSDPDPDIGMPGWLIPMQSCQEILLKPSPEGEGFDPRGIGQYRSPF